MERQHEEYVPLIKSDRVSAKPISKKQEPEQLGSVIDQVNSANYTVDQMTNLPFQIITAYDTRGISTTLAGFIVKVNLGSDAITTDHLSEELMLLVLGIRLALTLCNVASESMAEKERYSVETKRRKKVIARYKKMLEEVEHQLQNNNRPDWSHYNAQIFSEVIHLYALDGRLLSSQDEHFFYSALRYAIPAEKKDQVFEKLREFKADNNDLTREALEQAVAEAFAYRIKPTSIIKNKRIRSLLRNLKRLGDFILANVTGLALVTILASYIAILPFITVVMFPVYIAAIIVGLVFALLKVVRDVIDRKHEKIASKFAEEKGRYRQSQAMKKLLNHLQEPRIAELAPVVQENSNSNSNNNSDPIQVSQKPTLLAGGSLALRFLIALPMTVAVSSVSGWWAVLTVSGIVAGLGGPALLGLALILVPPISAGIVALYSLVKSFVNLYRDYHLEQEDLKQINKEWDLQNDRKQHNKILNNICGLSDAELLENYITEYLAQVNPNNRKVNSKDFFHNIQKMIGAKFSEARDANAFYSYLATKVFNGPSDSLSTKCRALLLVSQLKTHMEWIDLALMSEETTVLERNKLYVEKDPVGLKYTVIDPQGKTVTGKISRHNIPKLESLVAESFDLNAIKTILPQILGITHRRGHTIHGKNRDHASVGLDPNIVLTPKLAKKPKTASEKFRSGFDLLCAVIVPVIIGVGLALAFAAGPAFPFVAVGMVCLLGITSKISAKIKQSYQDRKKERESLRAKMTICDDTTGLLLRSGHKVPVHKDILKPGPPAPKKLSTPVVRLREKQHNTFFSEGVATVNVSLVGRNDFDNEASHVMADSDNKKTCTFV